MIETRLGTKRNDLIYIPVEARIRLLITGETFEVGGTIEHEAELERIVRERIAESVAEALDGTFSTPDGEMRIGTIAIGEFEPADPK